MDPQRLARRAGSFALLLLITLSVSNSYASLSRGHPSKDVRTFSGSAAADASVEPEPERAPNHASPAEMVVPDEPTVVVAVSESEDSMDNVTEPTRVAFGGGPTFGPKALGRLLLRDSKPAPRRGASGYLPEAGSVPLRFVAPHRWPDPLPPPVEEVAGPEIIFVFPPIAVSEPTPPDSERIAATADPEPSEEATVEVPAETYSAIADLITTEANRSQAGLTADMVVSSLNVLLHRGGDTPARFEPAIISDPIADVLTSSIQ